MYDFINISNIINIYEFHNMSLKEFQHCLELQTKLFNVSIERGELVIVFVLRK